MRAVPAGEHTEMVGAYLKEKTGADLTPGMFSAFAIMSDTDGFMGGVAISNFRGIDCEITCAAESPVAFRDNVIHAVFTYIFVQLGCVRCTCATTKRNKRTREFLEALGFVLEGNMRLGYDGQRDALIYGLLASECRFLATGGTDG